MKKTPLIYARDLHTVLLAANDADRRGIIRDFLAALARARRTNLRPRIVAAFNWLALAAEGYKAGVITTAQALDEDARTKLKKIFKNVIFEERIDPSLLGGAIVEVEDTRIDGSVRAKLNALKRTITGSI